MAELTPQERLQPSLLDRLTDDEPDQEQESRDRRVLTLRQLRASVMRDLVWLLNTTNISRIVCANEGIDLDEYPDVCQSVLNYGSPDTAGTTASSVDLQGYSKALREAISQFEPRILRNSLKVHAYRNEQQMNSNSVTIEIEGDLWAQPLPLRLFIQTELDLETGNISMADAARQEIA